MLVGIEAMVEAVVVRTIAVTALVRGDPGSVCSVDLSSYPIL